MDRSYLYGDGLFETVRVEGGRVHRLNRHIERLRESAEELGFGNEIVAEAVGALKSLPANEQGLWRVTVSRPGERGPFGGDGGVEVVMRPLPVRVRPSLLCLPGWYVPEDPLGNLKSTSYQRWVEAKRRAQADGADDALMIANDGRVGETSTSNVFIRFGATLATPPAKGLLPGVTRGAVIEHAAELGIKVVVRPIWSAELPDASEIICTSAGVLAVSASSLDDRDLEELMGPRISAALESGWP